ncbi:glycosyltransferase family 1 protein [Nitrospirales bacterium NOB]|nr:glycosyltransferase family 1 protein [Nitrospirales bacterium NOB]
MKRRRLLMASANYWRSPFQVGSHHLARGFARAGWEVGFVSDPISPWHLLGGQVRDVRERFDLYRHGGAHDCDGLVWTYVPGALLTPHNKPLLNSRWVGEQWPKMTRPRLMEVLRQRGFDDVDLLYCDSVAHVGWLDGIVRRKAFYRVTDCLAGFEKATPVALELERRLARSVDHVVYSARSLDGYVKTLEPRSMAYLPNAVNYAHFAEGDRTVPPEYATIPCPIAIYVGAMDVWFDYRLLDEAAARLPKVSFVLIGPDGLARQRLRGRANLHLLGPRPYGELPRYLHHADVGLIPFDAVHHAELVRSIHPLKLYEYAACGLPVVAVEWEELTYLDSPARLCCGTEAFVSAIEEAISHRPEEAKLQTYAASHDWGVRVATILAQLGLQAG